MRTPALLLLVVLAFIIIATAVIVVAALVQKPTRAWREQWAKNTADVRASGVKTLRGEPVQPKRVSFDELWVGVEARQAGLVQPRAVQGSSAHVPALVTPPQAVAKAPKYPPWSPPPEEPPPPTFDELLAADLIGSTNPGAPEVSATPDASLGQILAGIPKALESLWAKVTSRSSDALGEPKSEGAGAGKPVPDFPEPLPMLPAPPPEPEEPELAAPPAPPEPPELSQPHGYVHWVPGDDAQIPAEDAPPLDSWVGGLKYLEEPHDKEHWKAHLPKLSETASQFLDDDPNVLS